MYIEERGVTRQLHGSTPGFVLFSPVQGQNVYLINRNGQVAHEWSIYGRSTNWCELLPIGNLWVNEKGSAEAPVPFGAGLIREYDWDGNVIWEHEDIMQHHDARRLAHGGAVYAAWERLDSAVAARIPGGIPGTEINGEVYVDVIREVDEMGSVTWEWRTSELDFNAFPFHRNALRRNYGHCNSVDILPDGNYLISLKVLNALLIIERKTGNVIWTFHYDGLGGQHDAQMTPQGTILVFANNTYSPGLAHSQVWEIDVETKEIVWRFTEKRNPMNFFSTHISGVQRLSSGNTLICEGAKGCIFEVTRERDVVWQYINPYWASHPKFNEINWLYRARHYDLNSPEVRGIPD